MTVAGKDCESSDPRVQVSSDGRTVLLLTHRTEGLDRVSATYELRDGRLTPAAALVAAAR